jgi:Topoisomerase 6 subunit A/Spo11, Toprim domain
LDRVRGVTKAEARRAVLLDAWEEASAGLGYAPYRMVGYAARRLAEARFGIPADEFTITHRGDWGYALRTWEEQNPELAEKLNITRKARGRGFEPRTDHRSDFGTVEVRRYVRGWREPWLGNVQNVPPQAARSVHTSGPDGLYQGVLVVEKDGLLEFIRRAEIGERYDLMIASAEGQGVEAIKELIEQATVRYGLPVYLLHDFDISGMQIAAALSGRDTRSWTWKVQPTVIDLGINLEDIEKWDIQDESVSGEDDWVPLLEELGSSEGRRSPTSSPNSGRGLPPGRTARGRPRRSGAVGGLS